MAEQPETSQPTAEQRCGLFGCSRRRRNGSRGGGGRLFGRCFLVRDGGAAVQVGADEALAASDVVDTADRRVSSVRQREAWLLLCDGADALVAQVSVQDILPCSGDEQRCSAGVMALKPEEENTSNRFRLKMKTTDQTGVISLLKTRLSPDFKHILTFN